MEDEPERDHWQEYKDEQLLGPPREEPDDYDEPPLDLDEIEAAIAWAQIDPSEAEGTPLGEHGGAVWRAVPGLIAELRAARAELERLRTDARHEYTITDGTTPADDARLMPEQQADFVLAHPESLKQAWVRTVYVGPWQGLSAEPPF